MVSVYERDQAEHKKRGTVDNTYAMFPVGTRVMNIHHIDKEQS